MSDDTASLGRPPILVGYTYDAEDAYKARDENRLLAIRLETNRSCNLRCRYCYADGGERQGYELSYDVLTDVIAQARDMGAQSVVVIGGGEPTLHPRFRELISFISSLDMIPVIFTNTIAMTSDLAKFLYASNASVIGKLDSLRDEVQDFLAGQEGSFDRIQHGLKNLMDAGFASPEDPHRLRLGVSIVSCRMNLDEIAQIWHFCRQRNIFPSLEAFKATGRGSTYLPDQEITSDDIRNYKLETLDIDRKHYGFDWLPYTPLAASGCLQQLYSLYITIEGDVRPCAPTKFDEHPALKNDGVYPHNVLARPLKDIYEDPLFQYVRQIDRHLEGKCGGCEHLNECIGCRGYAYCVGVSQGKDPYSALQGECLQCFKGDQIFETN